MVLTKDIVNLHQLVLKKFENEDIQKLQLLLPAGLLKLVIRTSRLLY